jgi:DNA-3-methyladenine glycosylase
MARRRATGSAGWTSGTGQSHQRGLRLLCSGPGRLTEALGVTIAHNGAALDAPPFELRARSGDVEIVSGPRIGITKAVELPWRYGLKGSRFLSKPFRDVE